MSLERGKSEVNLFSSFLLKFEGKLSQISKQGTLTSQFSASTFERDSKKVRSTVLK